MTVTETQGVPHPGEITAWGDDVDVAELVCGGVREITHDVKTFWFEPVGPQVFHFDPGSSSPCTWTSTGSASSVPTRSPPRRPGRTVWPSR